MTSRTAPVGKAIAKISGVLLLVVDSAASVTGGAVGGRVVTIVGRLVGDMLGLIEGKKVGL